MSHPKLKASWTDDLRLTCNFCKDYVMVMGARDLDMARLIAARSGWVNDGKQDACPACAKMEVG